MEENTAIFSCIKCGTRLDTDVKQIFDELCDIARLQSISMCIVLRLVKTFKSW